MSFFFAPEEATAPSGAEADVRCRSRSNVHFICDCSKLARSHDPHNLMDALVGSVSRHKPNPFTITRYQHGCLPVRLDPGECHALPET